MSIDMSSNVLSLNIMVSHAVKRAVIHTRFLANQQYTMFDKSHPSAVARTHTMDMHMQTHIIKLNAIQSGVLQSQ